MRPPWFATIVDVIASPSPVPFPAGFVVKKGSRIFARRSFGTPGPSSSTWIATPSTPSSALARIETHTRPLEGSAPLARRSWSASIALPTRFMIT